MRSQIPVALEPGTYPVVLEPAAVATLAGFLAYVGFGGRAYIEDRSCFSGKADQQVAAPVDLDLGRRHRPAHARRARSTSKACRASAST